MLRLFRGSSKTLDTQGTKFSKTCTFFALRNFFVVDTQEFFRFYWILKNKTKPRVRQLPSRGSRLLPRDFHRWTSWNDDCEADCENARSKRHFRIFRGNKELSFRIFLVLWSQFQSTPISISTPLGRAVLCSHLMTASKRPWKWSSLMSNIPSLSNGSRSSLLFRTTKCANESVATLAPVSVGTKRFRFLIWLCLNTHYSAWCTTACRAGKKFTKCTKRNTITESSKKLQRVHSCFKYCCI